VIGEEQVVAAADRLVANTDDEARDLIDLYDADPHRVAVVPPGVDLGTFGPGGPGAKRTARRHLGVPQDADVLLFVGRIQPLKAPDVLLRAVERMLADDPARRDRLVVSVVGGPSGTGLERPEELQKLAGELGISDVVTFHPPASRPVLADWYRAADLVAVPSFSESFGLVAVEAQACGTPVVAADVGGLRTVVRDGDTGLLLPGHDPGLWSGALAGLLDAPAARDRMSAAACDHARRFSWDATVEETLRVYRAAASGVPARLGAGPRQVAVPAGDLAVAP
jgi:D-inositol-3-phosphate glycosyltransferase